MSDLAAAAEAMGLPEALVQRSAEARATETGMSTDEILTAWAGGGSVETTTAPAAEAPAPQESPPTEEPTEPEPSPAPAVIEVPSIPEDTTPAAPVPAYSGPHRPPTLIGSEDNPMAVIIAAIGLFVAVFLVGVVGSALGEEEPGARTSDIAYTASGAAGRNLYGSLGCAACHTQMVRPIVSDVGLGPTTLRDSNQILGTRRYGPDLSNVASRISSSQIEAVINGFGSHLDAGLDSADMDDLVAYLTETSE